ncbi:hypothetical protein FSP39_012610 [Pinctada imbricata]|uniref:lysoplasmalogenase n=1 Tax=Pinctada imbricata TaxID=66713 RepID=A0AA89BRV6_PINIB|nr:hypothetical protein FSP39_012610 [Pinctada imbricata]
MGALTSQLTNRALYPFYASVTFYFIVFQPCVKIPSLSIFAAIFKALPVWTLVLYVRLTSGDRSSRYLPKTVYHQNVMFALFFSSLGDIFLIFDTDLFEDGLLCFAVAQLFYFSVMRGAWSESSVRYVFLFACLVTFSYILNTIDDAIMDTFILLYLVLLYAMGWRATSKLLMGDTSSEGMAFFFGSMLFIVAETMLALNKLSRPSPIAEFVGCFLYYAAHLCYVITTGPVKIPFRTENVIRIILKQNI